jgi:hypothetical protein
LLLGHWHTATAGAALADEQRLHGGIELAPLVRVGWVIGKVA